jgi:cytochrome c6
MMATMRVLGALATLTLVATVSFEASSLREGGAIPAFSLQYNLTCNDCHVGASSKLNEFGQGFQDQGYQLPPHHDKVASTDVERDEAESSHVLYERFCLACHGPQGKGDGPMGGVLIPRAADLTSQKTRDKSDADLLKIIRDGTRNTVMPPFKHRLTADELRGMVAYVRSLSQ